VAYTVRSAQRALRTEEQRTRTAAGRLVDLLEQQEQPS
jgi:hypothetical protein